MEFKNEIIAELDIDYQDIENKATLTTNLVMLVYVRVDNKWEFVDKILLKDKPNIEHLSKVYEHIKDKYLNKPKVDYPDNIDPDDIPF